MKKSLFTATLIAVSGVAANAGTIFLYNADPDNNAGTPAPSMASQGWGTVNIDGQTTAATFANPGTTTGGAQAWVLDDTGPTGNTVTGNQSNIVFMDLSPALVTSMNADGFTLTMNFEQKSNGSFDGIGLNYDGVNSQFGFTANRREANNGPGAGLHSDVINWDTITFSDNHDSAFQGGNNDANWIGATAGGMRIFFGDNTRNSVGFNLAITSVTLTTDSVPEPSSALLLGAGALGFILRRRRK